MIRRLPVIPTIIVAAAVALMIGLGVWQLQRAKWKEGLLARYAEAETLPPIAFPGGPRRPGGCARAAALRPCSAAG